MKGIGPAVITALLAAVLAGCGSDNTTQFVLSSASSSASASASAASASASAGASPASSSSPTTVPTPLPGTARIIIDSPDGSSAISSPVEIQGTASVDKGTVVAVVLDAAGNELGRATTTASAVKPDWGHYDVSVSFTAPTSGAKGKLKVFGVSARDGTTPTYFYFINVTFA